MVVMQDHSKPYMVVKALTDPATLVELKTGTFLDEGSIPSCSTIQPGCRQ